MCFSQNLFLIMFYYAYNKIFLEDDKKYFSVKNVIITDCPFM